MSPGGQGVREGVYRKKEGQKGMNFILVKLPFVTTIFENWKFEIPKNH
jgi:hypothetical protein